MANVQHSALTDPNIHEPKGIASASSGQVYVANGSGSGSWLTQPGHAYGELSISNGLTAFTLASASATSKLNPTGAWTSTIYQNVTPSAANGQITITTTGVYKLDLWVIFNTASLASGTAYYFYYAVNGTPSTRTAYVKKTTNNVDCLHVSAAGLTSLTSGDVLSIYVSGDATSSGTNITVTEAGFTLFLIDPS